MNRLRGALLIAILGGSGVSVAGSHSWRVNEVFSNGDGTVQFIELKECCGANAENNLVMKAVFSEATGNFYQFDEPLIGGTANRHLLLATAGFADLPGAPLPDYILPDNFFSVVSDSISWHVYSVLTFSEGELPLDGFSSLGQMGTVAFNSPTNFAGETGAIALEPPGPPAVPDGRGESAPMNVDRASVLDATLTIRWDGDACPGASGYQVIYGQGSGLSAVPGGGLEIDGSVCNVSNPFAWSAPPLPNDGTGLVWWLVLATDGSQVEGGWGTDSAGVERYDANTLGASGECGMVEKNQRNTCRP